MRRLAVLGLAGLRWRSATALQRRFLARTAGPALRRVLEGFSGHLDDELGPDTRQCADVELPFALGTSNPFGGELGHSPRPEEHPERWSVACLEVSTHVLAFLILDRVTCDVVLVRDRMGEIPLCYFADDEAIGVAMLPEQLARAFPDRVRVDPGRIADVLVDALQWIDLQSTFYREIRKVPAGSLICINGRGVREAVYWRPSLVGSKRLPGNDGEFESAMLAALKDAVASRVCMEGTQVGSMLSGGMDSTSVAALAASLRANGGHSDLPVLSVLHSADPGCQESAAIRLGHALPGLRSHILDISRLGESASKLEEAMWSVDEPWDVHNSLLRWIYTTAAEIGLTSVLDGVDADTLFLRGDVPVRQLRSLHIRAAWRNVRGAQALWRSQASPIVEFIRAGRRAYGPWLAPARRVLGAGRRPRAVSVDPLSSLLGRNPIHPEFARRVDIVDRVARYEKGGQELGAFDFRGASHGVERYLRAAAPHGVVPSHPFMDVNLVELCVALPVDQCVADGWSKSVLRRATRGLLPEPIRWRVGKEHLGFHLTRCLVSGSAIPLQSRLRALREYLDGFVSEEVLNQHCRDPISSEPELVLRVELVALGEWIKRRSHLF